MPHFNLEQSAESMHFPIKMIMDSLNEALENGGGEDINYSHTPLNVSQGNTSSPLNLLASTPELVPNTSLRESRHQILTKLPLGF